MNDDTTRSAGPEPFQPAPPEPGPNLPPEPAPSGPDRVPTEPVRTPSVRPASGPSRAAMWVNVALGIALVVAIGGVAFAAGRMTAPTTAAAGGLGRNGTGTFRAGSGYFPAGGAGGAGGQNGGRGFLGGADGGLTVQGTVESSSGDALTIKTASGQTIQVALTGTTTYHAQTSASSSDVKTGSTVIVRVGGLRQPDASATTTGPSASDVTIVP